MSEKNSDYRWSDAFTAVPDVPAEYRLTPGPDQFLVDQLSASPLTRRSWRHSPVGPGVDAWAFLDGGVCAVHSFGGLDAVRVFGWQTVRWVSYGLRLDPPAEPLPGEVSVPTIDELRDRISDVSPGSAELRARADLLSAATDAQTIRQFVQRTFGDRGLSGPRRPGYPATGEWGSLGFTVDAAALLEGRFSAQEAAHAWYEHFADPETDESNDIAYRFWLQRELWGRDAQLATRLLPADPADVRPAGVDAAETAPQVAPEAPTAGSLAQTFLDQVAKAREDGDFSNVDYYSGDPEQLEPDEITADILARVCYTTAYGSMGDGRSIWILAMFPDGSAVDVREGELEPEPALFDLPADEVSGAQAIVDWCELLAPLAALDLEPLDPNGTLAPEERAVWTNAIAQSISSVNLPGTGRLGEFVREALGQDPVYARIKAALAEPTSREGELLLSAIEFLTTSPNELCQGDWEALEV
jgi:hypothetical protein